MPVIRIVGAVAAPCLWKDQQTLIRQLQHGPMSGWVHEASGTEHQVHAGRMAPTDAYSNHV